MAQALYDQTSVDIKAGELIFRATGSVLRFDGFVRVYLEGSTTRPRRRPAPCPS